MSAERTLRPSRLARSAAACALSAAALLFPLPSAVYPQARNSSAIESAALGGLCAGGGLREQVPDQYRERYERWKAAFLSAATGRQLWLKYACEPGFPLTVVVSKSHGGGAEVETEGYQWAGGKLVAATIILGHKLDRGYPGRLYYPVTNSLEFRRPVLSFRGDDILAAAKMAHEFGHIEQAAASGSYQRQNELLQVYASRFRSNGYDSHDPLLSDLARRLGGTPEEIAAEREHLAETYALRYLLDKLGARHRRELLKRVRRSLSETSGLLPSQTEWRDLPSPD